MKLIFYCSTFLLFFGCTRAVDSEKSKVIIQLPAEANSAASQVTASPFTNNNFVNKLETYESSGTGDDDAFSEIQPSGYSASGTTSSYPINCYLVAVKGPEEFMNRSSCKKESSGGTTATTYTFGPKLGLRSAGSTLELEVPPGDNREVMIFGLHAFEQADCKDLSLAPKKSSFTHPYFLGKSATLKFEPGKEISVPINLATVSQFADFKIEDCTFENDSAPPQATSVQIVTDRAPYGIFARPASGVASCHPIDVELKMNSLPLAPRATLNSPVRIKIAQINPSSGDLSFYTDYLTCVNDTALSLFINSFDFQAGESFKRIWIKPQSTGSQNVDYRPSVVSNGSGTAPSLLSSLAQFQYIPSERASSSHILDPVLPSKIKPDECYPLKMFVNNSSNGTRAVSILSDMLGLYLKNGPTPIASIYNSANCVQASQMPTIPFNPGSSPISVTEFSYSMKIPSSSVSGRTVLQFTSTLSGDITHTRHLVVDTPKEPYQPMLSNISAKTMISLKEGQCIPIHIELLDQKGFSFKTPGSKPIAFTSTALKIYADPTCTNNIPSPMVVYNNFFATYYLKFNTASNVTLPALLDIELKETDSGINQTINVLVHP